MPDSQAHLAISPMGHPRSFISTRGAIPAAELVKHTSWQRQQAFLLTGLLLDYPQDHWEDLLRVSREVCGGLPDPVGEKILRFLDWAEHIPQVQVEQLYVETFDQKRRCCLELTYYATGDTRQRGIALTVFQDLYAAVGWQLDSGCLPDYLPALLELASRCEGESFGLVQNMLSAHRQGIEILHAALRDLDSPWQEVVAGLRMVLPKADPDTFHKMQQLIRMGPPAELVGFETLNRSVQELPWPQTNSEIQAAKVTDQAARTQLTKKSTITAKVGLEQHHDQGRAAFSPSEINLAPGSTDSTKFKGTSAGSASEGSLDQG